MESDPGALRRVAGWRRRVRRSFEGALTPRRKETIGLGSFSISSLFKGGETAGFKARTVPNVPPNNRWALTTGTEQPNSTRKAGSQGRGHTMRLRKTERPRSCALSTTRSPALWRRRTRQPHTAKAQRHGPVWYSVGNNPLWLSG